MKKILVLICLMFVVQLFACDPGYCVFKARAVMKDTSEKTGYFLCEGHDSAYKEGSPMNEPAVFSLKNGANILEYIQSSYWFFIEDYIKLPWGYYFNTDTKSEFSFAKVDSLFYLSEDLPNEFKTLAPWHEITNKQISILENGICSYATSQGALNQWVYISTRDSISSDEIELYSLDGNVFADSVKTLDKVSFFCDTDGNRAILKFLLEYSSGNEDNRYSTVLEYLTRYRTRLILLKGYVDRNLIMVQAEKRNFNQQINMAIANMDVFIQYSQARVNKSYQALDLYTQICNMFPDDKTKKTDSVQRFKNAFSRTLIPRLSNHYDSDYAWEELDAKLTELGIVRLAFQNFGQ